MLDYTEPIITTGNRIKQIYDCANRKNVGTEPSQIK